MYANFNCPYLKIGLCTLFPICWSASQIWSPDLYSSPTITNFGGNNGILISFMEYEQTSLMKLNMNFDFFQQEMIIE